MNATLFYSTRTLKLTSEAPKTLSRSSSKFQRPRKRPQYYYQKMASRSPVIDAEDAPDEAITAEEIMGEAVPQAAVDNGMTTTTQKSRNACKRNLYTLQPVPKVKSPVAELMSKSKQPAKADSPNAKKGKSPSRPLAGFKNFYGRDGLGIYIQYPERNPEGRVIEYDDEFVVIQDRYPKARYATAFQAISCLH